jgi:hypothetical protein
MLVVLVRLHARATHAAAATALGARLKAASSTLTSTDFSTTFPSTISSNLSKSDAILIAYQEVVSALDSGAFGSNTMAAFENNINNNSSITSALLGVDPRTISIINEANSSSMGGLILSDKTGDETNTKPSNSLKRDNDSLSSVHFETHLLTILVLKMPWLLPSLHFDFLLSLFLERD